MPKVVCRESVYRASPAPLPRRGFTLVELLVVIAIIAILAAILFPVFAQAREKARQSVCLSNAKQIGMGATMYAQDYDDRLPDTGWAGPCHNPLLAAKTTGDAYFSGIFAWPLAIQPYIKSYGALTCPSDSDKAGFNKVGSACYEKQLIAADVPGAYAGISATPFGMRDVLPLSYAGNYMISSSYATPTSPRVAGGGMRPMSAIASPANLFLFTDVGSNAVGASVYYTTPGYGNSTNPKAQWPSGRRHQEGRIWVFADGHAKWIRDPELLNANGTAKTQGVLMEEYRQRAIYTYPETDSSE